MRSSSGSTGSVWRRSSVDLTTDELRDVGLWAVRVIIPALMPISFVHRARFLGTPRLGIAEDLVNPDPLPFA